MRRLPRIRFSLRTLFLITTAVGLAVLPLAIRGYRLQDRLRRQWAAVEAVKQLGGTFGREEDPEMVAQVYFTRNLNDEQIASLVPHLKQFPKLKRLQIHSWRMTDKSVRSICELKAIEELHLQDVPVTDEAAKDIRQLSKLKSLIFQGERLTDQAFVELNSLSDLEVLVLSSPAITDDGLMQLAALPKLKQLNTGGTKISDQGLKDLSSQRAVFDATTRDPRVYFGAASRPVPLDYCIQGFEFLSPDEAAEFLDALDAYLEKTHPDIDIEE